MNKKPKVHMHHRSLYLSFVRWTRCGLLNGVVNEGKVSCAHPLKSARAWKDVTCKNCLRTKP